MTVVGARPNFMKAAPIISAIRTHNERLAAGSPGPGGKRPPIEIKSILVHTGQHYDEAMSGRFFDDLGIPSPEVHLGAGSGSHAVQTAEIMKRFEGVLLEHQPDILVVVGDVNSTIACALVAAKVAYDAAGTRPLIAHVEAGLRSFDSAMPEEVNRVLTDHLADLLFVTEESGLTNLRREGISDHKLHFVGNTMIDTLLAFKEKAAQSSIHSRLGLRDHHSDSNSSEVISPYAVLTLHRPSNVDSADGLLRIIEGLRDLMHTCPVIFPAHPRTQKRITDLDLGGSFVRLPQDDCGPDSSLIRNHGRICMVDPLGYLDFLNLMRFATVVVTDSGGIQEETTCLGVPCVTVRENTERPITIEVGSNVLAGTTAEGIQTAIRSQIGATKNHGIPELWDGKSAERILDVLCMKLA